jgi:hypothetical protein
MARFLRGWSTTIVLGMMALMLLAACGDDNDDTGTTGAAAPTAVPATAVAPAADAKPVESRLIIANAIPSVESNIPYRRRR